MSELADDELMQLVLAELSGQAIPYWTERAARIAKALRANPDVVLRALTPHVRDAIGELRCTKGHAVDLVALSWEES